MYASMYGHLDVVRTLIEAEADIKAQSNVRNQIGPYSLERVEITPKVFIN